MKRKPIRIDWEELESAFDNKREDLVYYLDLVTGHVVLEGEGEDLLQDEEDFVDEGGSADAAPRKETTRLYIEPPGPLDEGAWMAEFVADARDADPAMLDRLEQALEGSTPAESFREVLRSDAGLRDRWFLYRADRIHEAIEAWLDANEVRASKPAPWQP